MDDTGREASGGLMVTAATILKLRPNEPRFFPDALAKRDTVATRAQSFPMPHKFSISPILNVAFWGENGLKQLADNVQLFLSEYEVFELSYVSEVLGMTLSLTCKIYNRVFLYIY